jgi:hypothetical protein
MLTIISGKPGSGKSYHCASMVTDMLSDWLRYEHDNEKPFPRKLFSNIKFNCEKLDIVISERLGYPVQSDDYVSYLDDDFFVVGKEYDEVGNPLFWWNDLESGSLIVIDEVHKYIGKSFERRDVDDVESFVNWISTHRHYNQDLIFITQHIENFAVQILGIADTLMEVVNLKNQFLPFPFNVPVSDLDVIKEAFGIKTQYYVVNIGNFRGRFVRWSGGTEKHLMHASIYSVYQSHALPGVTGDRPSLKLKPLDSIFWFLKKHGYHLIPKFLGVVCGLPFFVYCAFYAVPLSFFPKEALDSDDVDRTGFVVVTKPEALHHPVDLAVGGSVDFNNDVVDSVDYYNLLLYVNFLEEELVDLDTKFADFGSVVVLSDSYLILKSGKKIKVSDQFEYDGVSGVISSIDVREGIITFVGGSSVQLQSVK